MTDALLTVNKYSRPGRTLETVSAIVLHWFANPGQSARGARNFWESRKEGVYGFGAGHFAIDDTEVLQCIPVSEMAYHVGAEEYTDFALCHIGPVPNARTIGVELAHPSATGQPTDRTWFQAVRLSADLCRRYSVPESMIVTHWDVTGQRPYWNAGPCHRWFVEQPGELARFRAEVAQELSA
jgi:N-acetylmuramoyl-L-alanine amidase